MPQPRAKLDWRPILLEAFFVVFGVVLALAANEWRQAQVDRRNAETALASIREELEANRHAVLESVRYHLQLVDTLSALARRPSGSEPPPSAYPDGRLFSRGFFAPATLLHTAWDAAAATDAVRHMRYDDVLRLAQIYEEQDRYRRQSEQVGQLVYSHLFTRGFQGMLRNYANLGTVLAAVWYRECQLLHRYGQVLSQLSGADGAGVSAVPEACEHVPAA